MRSRFGWVALLLACSADAAAQGHQYYEQFRANRWVSGTCEGISEFTNQLRQALVGDWEQQDVLKFKSGGSSSLEVFGKKRYTFGNEHCNSIAQRRATMSFGPADAFGGVSGQATFGADISTPPQPPAIPGQTVSCLDARGYYQGISSGQYDFSLALPIEESGGKCSFALPTLRLTSNSGSTEHKMYLIDANTFGLIVKGGDMIFKRRRSSAR